MIRRPLRPHWSNTDNPKLIAAMKAARDWIIRYESAQRFHSTEVNTADNAHKALDTLAYVVTGKADALVEDLSMSHLATPAPGHEVKT